MSDNAEQGIIDTNTQSAAQALSISAEPVAPVTAKEKLREFEDNVFGKKAGRINGEVERGIGSPFAAMTPHQQQHYAALERLVAAEKDMADASAAMAAAQATHGSATKAIADAEKAMDDTE